MAKSLAHTKYMCKYHIIFIPKYRRKTIYNKLRADIQKYIKRQALHAYKVTFNHPVTNKKMEITASIPEDMKELIPTQILNFQQLQKE